MSVNVNFDASQGPSGFISTPLPSGLYSLMIMTSALEPTKRGDGQRLVLDIVVADGPEKGKSIKHGINWENPNPKAVQIGQAEFRAICQTVGVMNVPNTQVLHNIPFGGEVEFDGKYSNLLDVFPVGELATRLTTYVAPPTPVAPTTPAAGGAPFTPGAASAPAPTAAPAFTPPPQSQPGPAVTAAAAFVQPPQPPQALPGLASAPMADPVAVAAPVQTPPVNATSPSNVAPPAPPAPPATAAPTAATPDWIVAQQAAAAAAQPTA